jgi:hypothetical protein
MTALLPELERRLTQAAQRRWDATQQDAIARGPRAVMALRWRNAAGEVRRSTVALVAAVLVMGGGGIAAASGLIPFGDPLPAHSTIDADAGSVRIVAPLVDDPAGGPPWTARTFEARGFTCTQIGRLQDGVFGLVGADRRFHAMSPDAGGRGCGGPLAISDLQGGVLSAGDPNDLRFLNLGILGPDADSLTYLPVAGQPRTLQLTPEGGYLLVTEGDEAPSGELVVKYRDGETRRAAIDPLSLARLARSR